MSAHTSTNLDHIIILVPNSYLKKATTPSWLAENFTITPGGQHADRKTENTLITLADGVYLELIAFVNDEEKNRHGHWWGGKRSCSIVDWCLTGQINEKRTEGAEAEHESIPFDYPDLIRRISTIQKKLVGEKNAPGVLSYATPVRGGRDRPDGKRVEWAVTFPTMEADSSLSTSQKSRPPGIPFFCHDVTARPLRLSTDDPETKLVYTTHPCGAIGIAYVQVGVPKDQLDLYANMIATAMDGELKYDKKRVIVGTPEGREAAVYIVEKEDEAEIGVMEIGIKVEKNGKDDDIFGTIAIVGEGDIRIKFVGK